MPEESGLVMDGAGHHVERYVRDTFGLDEIGLRRVAVFLLAHVRRYAPHRSRCVQEGS